MHAHEQRCRDMAFEFGVDIEVLRRAPAWTSTVRWDREIAASASRFDVRIETLLPWSDQRVYVTALHELGHVALGHLSNFGMQNWRETEAEAWLWALDQLDEPVEEATAKFVLGPDAFGSIFNRMRPVGAKTEQVYAALDGGPPPTE